MSKEETSVGEKMRRPVKKRAEEDNETTNMIMEDM